MKSQLKKKKTLIIIIIVNTFDWVEHTENKKKMDDTTRIK